MWFAAFILLLLPWGITGLLAGVPEGAPEPVFRSEIRHGLPAPDLDSLALVREARDAQARFERVRVFRSPWGQEPGGGACDEVVGRFCLRLSGEREDERVPPWRPPPEHPALAAARDALDAELSRIAAAIPGDAWVAGQRVAYRGEAGDWEGALAAARSCRSPEPGWCGLLEGYALHGGGRLGESERRFSSALDELPPDEARRLRNLEPLLEPSVAQALERLSGEERSWLEGQILHLGNPLFLVGGHPLLTEHLSRHVLARIRFDARNPHGMRWGDDLSELLVRFGPVVGWERVREPAGRFSLGPAPMTGRYAWEAKGVFPTLEGLLDPTGSGAEAFPAAVFRARSRHAVPGVPRIRGLEARTARLLRGEALDSVLVLVAWQLPPSPAWDTVPALRPSNGGLFLLREARGVPQRWPVGEDLGEGLASGVAAAQVPAGRWWFSLEVIDEEGGRAWRHRQGVVQAPLAPGEVALSDLLLLRPALPGGDPVLSPDPGGVPSGTSMGEWEALAAHAARMLPSDTLVDRRLEVGWEVYGTPSDPDRLRFVLGVEPREPGRLRRAGEFLRLLAPLSPVEIAWEEGGVGQEPASSTPGAPLLRRVELDLSALDPGPWTLTLQLLDPGGRVLGERSTQVVLR